MRIHWATPWRFTAQPNAESPPPTSSTRFPVKILGSRMRSCSPLPYQRSTSLSGSLRGVNAPIPPAMSTVRDGYWSVSVTTVKAGLPFCDSRFRPITFRSEEHTSELQSRLHLVCRLLLEKKKPNVPETTSKHTIAVMLLMH